MLCSHGKSVCTVRPTESSLLEKQLWWQWSVRMIKINDFITLYFPAECDCFCISFEKRKKREEEISVKFEHKLFHKAALASLLSIQRQISTGLSHSFCCILQRSCWRLSSFKNQSMLAIESWVKGFLTWSIVTQN